MRGESETAVANDSSRTARQGTPAAEPVEASENLHPLEVALRSAVSLAFASGLSPDEVSDIVGDVEKWSRRQPRMAVTGGWAGTVHAAGELTQRWSTDAEFLDNGQPRVLPLKGRKGSFAALARRTGVFKNSAEALEVLARHGAAESDGKTVTLKTRIVIADWTTPEARARAWMSAVTHLNTLNLNASDRPKDEKRPERMALNMNFPTSVLPALRKMVEKHGDAFLLLLDQFMREHAESARERGEPTQAIGVGFTMFDVPRLGEDKQPPSPRKRRPKARRP